MPRKATLTEIFRSITTLERFNEPSTGAVSTTLASAAAALDPDCEPAAITGFATLDPILIDGSGGTQLNHINGAPSAGPPKVITFKYPLRWAQGIGAEIVKMNKVTLGYLENNGLSISPSKQITAITAANADVALAYQEGILELKSAFGVISFNGPNFTNMVGLEDNETGAGSPSDPYESAIAANEAKLLRTVLRGSGTLHDSQQFHVDMINARFEASGSVTMNKQGGASLPCNIGFTTAILRLWK